MAARLRGYCHQCAAPRRTGFCVGTEEKPHPAEACPPCDGCPRVCDWRHGRGCGRFAWNPDALGKANHTVPEHRQAEWGESKRAALIASSKREAARMTGLNGVFAKIAAAFSATKE